VVAILQAPVPIATHSLDVRAIILRDTHVGPGRRYGKLLDARLQRLVANSSAEAVNIGKALAATATAQAEICGLRVSQAMTAAKLCDVLQHGQGDKPAERL
jgi:hypothetical protein